LNVALRDRPEFRQLRRGARRVLDAPVRFAPAGAGPAVRNQPEFKPADREADVERFVEIRAEPEDFCVKDIPAAKSGVW